MRKNRGGHEVTHTTNYWNHNTAYHPELLRAVRNSSCRVLDVGCGDGLLLQKFSTLTPHVTGIDSDESALETARARLGRSSNARIVRGNVLTSPELESGRFDLVICVATLHHLPLVAGLQRLGELVAPGGELRVVGLSANKTIADWVVSAALLAPIRLASALHGESDYPGMTTARPHESLTDIRRTAARILPGSHVRRRLYYRYTLSWHKP